MSFNEFSKYVLNSVLFFEFNKEIKETIFEMSIFDFSEYVLNSVSMF